MSITVINPADNRDKRYVEINNNFAELAAGGGGGTGETVMQGLYTENPPTLTEGQESDVRIGEASELLVRPVFKNEQTGDYEDATTAIVSALEGIQSATGTGLTDAQLRASALNVTGPLTNAQFTALLGAVTSAAVTNPASSATVIALLKGCISLLQDIKTNTASVLVDEG